MTGSFARATHQIHMSDEASQPQSPPPAFQVTSPLPNSDEDDEEEEDTRREDESSSAGLDMATDSEEEEEEGEEDALTPVLPWLEPPSSDTNRERDVDWIEGSSSYETPPDEDIVRILMPETGKSPPNIAEILKCTLITYAVVSCLCYAFLVFAAAKNGRLKRIA